jgi:ubiquinone/menaquinone biosynthesis C-methylase UbiE
MARPRSQQAVTRHYNLIGRTGVYDAVVSTFLLGRDSSLRSKILSPSTIATGDRVLDVGTGTGRNLPLLSTLVGPSGTVVGVDLADGMLARAKRRSHRLENVTLVHGDALELRESTAGLFDVVVATYFFSVVVDPHRAARTLLSVLRPGGMFLVLEAGFPDTKSRLFRSIVRFEEWIACSDLRVDVTSLVPAALCRRQREFRFWRYIMGAEMIYTPVETLACNGG